MSETQTIQLNRSGATLSFSTVKLSGKARVAEVLVPVAPEEDDKLEEYLQSLIGFVGPRNFCTTIEKEILRKAAVDAHLESTEDDGTGKSQLNPDKYIEEFAEYFAPSKRGGKASDLQSKIIELNAQLCELFQESNKERDPSKLNIIKTKMSRIVVETQKIQGILAEKEQKKLKKEEKKQAELKEAA